MSEVPIVEEPVVQENGRASLRWYEFFADKDAYKPYTPTITASSGTFTTVAGAGHHKKKGRTVFFNVVITITTVGTAAGAVLVPLPFTSASHAQVLSGRETQAGNAINGYIPASSSQMEILRYDANTIAASSRTLVISGSYESAS